LAVDVVRGNTSRVDEKHSGADAQQDARVLAHE
jgi:hypothetical protein